MGLWYKTICLGNTVVYNYSRRVILISSFSDAIVFHNHVHTGRNIHISRYKKRKKQNNILAYSMYSMLYLNVKIAHNALEQNIIIRHLFVQFIVSAKYIHTVHIPCLCSVNNI